MNTTKRSVIVSAVLAIALCVSLIVGATFALFTSESQVNVAVTSGKVDVTASVDESSIYTKDLNDTDYVQGTDSMFNATVTLDADGLKLENVVPGDAIKFNIVVANNSNVAIKYRTIISCEAGDLFSSLVVTLGEGDAASTFNGVTAVSDWASAAVGEGNKQIAVQIELPRDATVQNAFCKIVYKVEAVQGNAVVDEDTTNVLYIYNANDLMTLSESGNGGKPVIEFLNNIDMNGKNYVTVESGRNGFSQITEVRGNGHVITNLGAPLFDLNSWTVTIKDLTIQASQMTNNSNSYGFGAFISDADICEIAFENCHVINCEIDGGSTWTAAFVGRASRIISFNKCSVQGGSITSQGSVGGFVGHTNNYYDGNGLKHGSQTFTDCKVIGVTITATDSDWRIGTFIGTTQGTSVITNATSQGNSLVMYNKANVTQTIANPNHELYGRIVDEGVTGHDNATLVIDGVTYTAGQ